MSNRSQKVVVMFPNGDIAEGKKPNEITFYKLLQA